MGLKSLIRKFQRVASNPRFAAAFAYKTLRTNTRLAVSGEYMHPANSNIIDEEWDVLVVLDACRYDVLADVNPFGAVCQSRRSQAPATTRWFKSNFEGLPRKKTENVVYVTANPNASTRHIDSDPFYHIEDVFAYAWDPEVRTVPADVVTDVAIQMQSKHPQKRLIVHYLQPHEPLIGHEDYSPQEYYPNCIQNDGVDLGLSDSEAEEIEENLDTISVQNSPYLALRAGKVSREKISEMYRANLEYVLEPVDRLLEYMDGQVVITGDHGEAFGDGGVYGHPGWAHAKSLLTVPWIELEGGGNEAEQAILQREFKEYGDDDTSIEEKLKHLGYV